MLWDNEASWRKFQELLKGVHDTRVGSHPPLKGNRLGKRLAFAKVGDEIPGQGVAKTCNDVGLEDAFLQEVDHIAFGKDTASTGDPGGMFGAKSEGTHIFDRYSEAVGLKIEKGACAGRTHFI
jgi:hypothetical protein